ncbi:MAG: transporter [Herbinix sp.]|nr:transporter [Herbinix sp.]
MKTKSERKPSLILIMVIYLFGVFMGAIDTGIVTPARTIIQNNLDVNEQVGIWMITIYTLAYAASIPIMGKLADKFGRKYIYLTSIFLFGLGSLFCGLSQNFGSFTLLLIARVIQAIGGGGIMPIATAEFGTSFPAEKRGMALGLVGGVYGVANIFGASAGSAILNLFGVNNWQFIFYINIPIAIFVLIIGFLTLPNTKITNTRSIDYFGILTIVTMVVSLLYGLTNIDFFHFKETLISTEVYPFLLLFLVLLPIFLLIEKKVSDPVMNLSYFTNKNILLTLIISFISGIVMMGMIFVPQFSENALKIASGNGGYFVIILGVFAGFGAPLSGKLIDRFGVKFILSIGFIVSIIGSLFLIFVTTNYPNIITVAISLMLIGVGIGFTMGTPLNYMMLQNTDAKESNSALATLSLIRSIGTAVAPAIMVGFLAHAGSLVQTDIMNLLPKEITLPPLPYSQEITAALDEFKENPQMKDKLANVTIPDLASMQTVEINFNSNSNYKMPDDLIALMQTSDVTTITQNSQTLADRMFEAMSLGIITKIQTGIDSGIQGITTGSSEMAPALSQLKDGYNGISEGIAGMQAGLNAQKSTVLLLKSAYDMLTNMGTIQLQPGMSIADLIPANIEIPPSALEELEKVTTAEELKQKIDELNLGIEALEQKVETNTKNKDDMAIAITAMESSVTKMNDLKDKMTTLKAAIPSSFETAKSNYIGEIGSKDEKLQDTFQATLNQGFKNVYYTAAIAAFIALVLLMFYKSKKVDFGDNEKNN